MENELLPEERLHSSELTETGSGDLIKNGESGHNEKSLFRYLRENKQLPGNLHRLFLWLVSVLAGITLFVFFLYIVPLLQEIPSAGKSIVTNTADLKKEGLNTMEFSISIFS